MSETTTTSQALKDLRTKWIDPPVDLVQTIKQGSFNADYFGHAETTDALLQSDIQWNWEPLARDENGAPLITEDPSGKMFVLWITLTIHGVSRIGVGSCKKAGKDDVAKELVGDAIRNAAMRFGVALNLWAKSELKAADAATPGEPVARKSPEAVVKAVIPDAVEDNTITDTEVKSLQTAYTKAGIPDAERKKFAEGVLTRLVPTHKSLSHDEYVQLKKAIEAAAK